MFLPAVQFEGKRRQQMIDFRGVNYSENYSDGEFSHTENLRSDLYPTVSPRSSRRLYRELTSPGGIYAGDDLFLIDGDVVYRNGEAFAYLESQHAGREILVINSKLVVFPDKVYFNLDDKNNYILTKAEPSDWNANYRSYFTYDEDSEEYIQVAEEAAPIWVGGRYYRYISAHPLDSEISLGGGTFEMTSSSIILNEDSLYELYPAEKFITMDKSYYSFGPDGVKYSASKGTVSFENFRYTTTKNVDSEVYEGDIVCVREHKTDKGKFLVYNGESAANYETLTTALGIVTKMIEVHKSGEEDNDSDYLRYEVQIFRSRERASYGLCEGFSDVFKSGDAVKISGAKRHPENNLTLSVRDVIGNTLIFDDNVFTPADIESGVSILREVPDFDVVCEYNNRLFGADEEKIYVSALGDPTNWNTFDGLSTDSYHVAVASAGKFTGCIGFSGSVLFFKEDTMYKLMGDYPSNFALYSYNVAGVAEGSAQSLVNINERLFYHGKDGIYAYSGSLPQLISENFGTRRFENAVGGAFGNKYYVSMRDIDGDASLYVYDALRGIWLREDDTEVIGFAEHGEDRLMLCADGKLYALDSGEEIVEWSAETCEISEFMERRKCYSKLLLRLDMTEGSRACVDISCDRGNWRNVWNRDFGGTEGEYRSGYTASIPIRPTRCDRFKIRIYGKGEVVIRSLVREYEFGSDV